MGRHSNRRRWPDRDQFTYAGTVAVVAVLALTGVLRVLYLIST